MSRGNGRMAVFLDDRDYRQFIYYLGEIVEEFGLTCWNYCVMPNHYHATLQPSLPNLSRAIQKLDGAYGQWWNRRHDRAGHVFQGRFKNQIVDYQEYLLTLSRYVVMNPVRAGIVSRPEDWHWSSYRATAGLGVAPSFLSVGYTLSLFGSGEEAVLRERFVASVARSDDPAMLDRIRSNEQILGPKDFKYAVRGGLRFPLPPGPPASPSEPGTPLVDPAAAGEERKKAEEGD
jgi:REP element-mobilizing transposase RayT